MTPRLRVGGSACQCPTCNLFFRSVSGFDKHRTGDQDQRRCLTTVEMEQAGMAENAEGYWVAERWTEDDRERRGRRQKEGQNSDMAPMPKRTNFAV